MILILIYLFNKILMTIKMKKASNNKYNKYYWSKRIKLKVNLLLHLFFEAILEIFLLKVFIEDSKKYFKISVISISIRKSHSLEGLILSIKNHTVFQFTFWSKLNFFFIDSFWFFTGEFDLVFSVSTRSFYYSLDIIYIRIL